jgi:hypothetical protein
MTNESLIDLLSKYSPFVSDNSIVGEIIEFREGIIIVDGKGYDVKSIEELDYYVNIQTSSLLFELNILVEIEYSKPIYINYNQSFITPRGFITFKSKKPLLS